MSTNPCQICGCTDLNLVDGFYYCVECGTQDVNIRETVVEKTIIADYGTAMVTDVKKFTTVLKDAVQMSGEWCKWHGYNFILVRLADELLALGARPTVKLKVLWIWLRYIKKFQKKDEPEATIFENKSVNEDDEEELNQDDIDSDLDKTQCEEKNKEEKFRVDINHITCSILLAILYIALNLDKSHIQLSHLFQFIREGRLSIFDCLKFVPKELSFRSTPNYIHFENSNKFSYQGGVAPKRIRQVAMTLFKRLGLGVPLVPDLNKIISNYITELCLPNDFKDLVLSLTSLLPCDLLEMNALTMKCTVFVPDYEAYCMSYVLLALKMCFGLDSNYEIKLSDAVDRINSEEDYLKCYNLNMYSEPSDRLFSFREWCMFLQFRRRMLSKHYLPMANQLKLPADDCTFMEHSDKRKAQNMRLSYDVAMDILNKIPSDNKRVIPKDRFPVTLIPMTTYTDIIKENINEPELKLCLSEDFSQYSLKYATKDLKLPGCDTMCKGVDKMNKIINPHLLPRPASVRKYWDTSLVLVRNCDNKNWLKTKPPKIKHVTETNGSINDSSTELSSESDSESESDDEKHDSDEEMYDDIEEEDEELSIFDDDFKNLHIEEDRKDSNQNVSHIEHVFEFHNNNINDSQTVLLDSKTDIQDTFSENSVPEMIFNPETFNRDKVIKELIMIACRKFKIPIPKEKEDRMPIKRKKKYQNEAGVNEPKRKKSNNRMKPGEAAKLRLELVNAYYENVNNDLFVQLSEHVKSVVETIENQAECNIADDALNNETDEIQDTTNHNEIATGDTENLRNSTEALNNDENAPFNDNDTLDETANGAIDEDDDNREYDIQELLPKVEPNFDPQTHDVKQLYLNMKNEFSEINLPNIDNDPDVNDMIDKKIAEFHDFNENEKELHGNDTKMKMVHEKLLNDTDNSENIDINDSDDEPLSKLYEKKLLFKKKKDTSNLDYLIANRNKIVFKYWMKHESLTRNLDLKQTFHIELSENYPKSFVFVLNECAAISNVSPFNLYGKLNCLEELILKLFRRTKSKI